MPIVNVGAQPRFAHWPGAMRVPNIRRVSCRRPTSACRVLRRHCPSSTNLNKIQAMWAARTFVFATLLFADPIARADWPQFGGSSRDFVLTNAKLSTDWQLNRPKERWRRPLGDGFSGISIVDDRLVTMYREGDEESIVCLAPIDGKTRWEHRYAAPVDEERFASRYGYGPRSTPLIDDDRVYAAGYNGMLHCLDLKSGRVLWKCDLIDKFDGNRTRWGYACSPMRIGETIVMFTGGAGASVVALDRKTGRTTWRRHDFRNSYGSPMVIDVAGQSQLICFMMKEVVGLDPDNGDLLWRHPHENQWDNNIVMPVYGDDGILFVTSEGSGGARALQLTRSGGATRVMDLWHTRKLKVSHRNVIRIGDYIYASNGDFGPKSFDCIHVKTGEFAWRRRDFPKCGLLRVGNDLLMLAEDGRLMIATPTPEALTVHSEIPLLGEPAWTIPSLIGDRLYLRDRTHIVALELPAARAAATRGAAD